MQGGKGEEVAQSAPGAPCSPCAPGSGSSVGVLDQKAAPGLGSGTGWGDCLFFSSFLPPFFPQAIPEHGLSTGFGDEHAEVRWARQVCEQLAKKAAALQL